MSPPTAIHHSHTTPPTATTQSGHSITRSTQPRRADSLADPTTLLEYLDSLGSRCIGLNIEEREGSNIGRPVLSRDEARVFWRQVIDWQHGHSGTRFREVDRLLGYLHLLRTGRHTLWDDGVYDPIPTVGWNGDVVLLSPELLGTRDATYRNFVVGNVLRDSLPDILDVAHEVPYVREFLLGMERCRVECEFFDFCRGAQAGNRYFEHGSFVATETDYCRGSRQALVLAMADVTTDEGDVCDKSDAAGPD